MKNLRIVDILKTGQVGAEITVKGWVRTRRGSKNVNFIALNDGSTINNLQIVADVETFGEEIFKNINTGAAVGVTGILAASGGSGQAIELQATALEVIGVSDPEKYPIQPKRHSLEFLREMAHLRPRTATYSAIFRIRHAMILPFIISSTTEDFIMFIHPLSRVPMRRVPAKCFVL